MKVTRRELPALLFGAARGAIAQEEPRVYLAGAYNRAAYSITEANFYLEHKGDKDTALMYTGQGAEVTCTALTRAYNDRRIWSDLEMSTGRSNTAVKEARELLTSFSRFTDIEEKVLAGAGIEPGPRQRLITELIRTVNNVDLARSNAKTIGELRESIHFAYLAACDVSNRIKGDKAQPASARTGQRRGTLNLYLEIAGEAATTLGGLVAASTPAGRVAGVMLTIVGLILSSTAKIKDYQSQLETVNQKPAQ